MFDRSFEWIKHHYDAATTVRHAGLRKYLVVCGYRNKFKIIFVCIIMDKCAHGAEKEEEEEG